MPLPSLPSPAAEFAERLSRPLAPRRDGLELTVSQVRVATDSSEHLTLAFDVVATRPDHDDERWRLTVPIDAEELSPLVALNSLVVTFRANIEEWWDTRSYDELIASRATRI
jgi:hypothetical protein